MPVFNLKIRNFFNATSQPWRETGETEVNRLPAYVKGAMLPETRGLAVTPQRASLRRPPPVH